MSKSRALRKESTISAVIQNNTDYINLTDLTFPFPEGIGLIGNRGTNENKPEYLGVWKKIKGYQLASYGVEQD